MTDHDNTKKRRQKALRERRKLQGLVRLELWLTPEDKEKVKAYALSLAASDLPPSKITFGCDT